MIAGTVSWAECPSCHPKNMAGWWKWALVSPDGVAPSRLVGVCLC